MAAMPSPSAGTPGAGGGGLVYPGTVNVVVHGCSNLESKGEVFVEASLGGLPPKTQSSQLAPVDGKVFFADEVLPVAVPAPGSKIRVETLMATSMGGSILVGSVDVSIDSALPYSGRASYPLRGVDGVSQQGIIELSFQFLNAASSSSLPSSSAPDQDLASRLAQLSSAGPSAPVNPLSNPHLPAARPATADALLASQAQAVAAGYGGQQAGGGGYGGQQQKKGEGKYGGQQPAGNASQPGAGEGWPSVDKPGEGQPSTTGTSTGGETGEGGAEEDDDDDDFDDLHKRFQALSGPVDSDDES